jgi:hypothetical protein
MKNTIIISSLALLAAFTSCRKTIDIQVKDSDRKYVIEGSITNQNAPVTVRISGSIGLGAENEFPGVSGAHVSITDLDNGTQYKLTEMESGIYQSPDASGTPGHQYQLTVNIEGQRFTALSTMPEVVSLDSVYILKGWTGTELKGVYRDPGTKRNYYHYVTYRNGKREKGVSIGNDEASDGQTVTKAMIAVNDTVLKAGDRLVAMLECVDPAAYQYYYGLAMGADQSYSAPANPKSNISGGVLGYFSAYTVSSRQIQVR